MNYISEKETRFVISKEKLDELRKKKPSQEYIKEKELLEKARCKDSELGYFVYDVKLID